MKIELANYRDIIRAESGDIPAESIRRFDVEGDQGTRVRDARVPAGPAPTGRVARWWSPGDGSARPSGRSTRARPVAPHWAG